LVNITAGMDISIDEFETVGNAVKAFASENATVVVGAVIDMDMTDELRVTVVATGIGAEAKPDITLVNPMPVIEPKVVGADYTPAEPQLNTAIESIAMTDSNAQKNVATDLDTYLDIPAFLRKQAD
jgi:cell division protein FtsZ